MKRNMDLIRKILFFIEDHYVAGEGPIYVEIDGYSSNDIYEHCILVYQAGYIQKPLDVSTLESKICMVENLTNKGFEFVEKIRHDNVWSKTKNIISDKKLSLTLSTIDAVASTLISAMTEGAVSAIIKNNL